ncbi:response regulator [Verrucomicrobiota bacterium]
MDEYKILVIEDDRDARDILARVVAKEGFKVIAAEDGREGLAAFEKEHPQIVVTDLRMPHIDGIQVMRAMRQVSPSPEVIVVTGYGETDTAISALREGALDYLQKPIDLDQLATAIGRAKEKIDERRKAPFFPSVLLAEDDRDTCQRLADELGKEGWKVIQVHDGEEAIIASQKTKIDVVLLDIKMPRKDGLQVLHEMRAMGDDFEAIILTGYGDEASAIQAMRDGAINFLKKPIDLDQMILTVEKAIAKLSMARALKYRLRELELSREIIARITADEEIIIDAHDHLRHAARKFAQRLLDAIPVGLIIFDRELNVRYVNESLVALVGHHPEKMSEELVRELAGSGSGRAAYRALVSGVDKVLQSSPGALESVSITKRASLTLSPLTVLGEKKETLVLMATAGGKP